MMRTYAWLLVGLLGCTKAGGNQQSEAQPEPIVVSAQAKMPPPPPAPAPPPTQPPVPAPPPPPPAEVTSKITVQMTAATLADDCGGSPPRTLKSDSASEETEPKAKSAVAKADRACDQTSMQLSVKASAGGGATRITVKKVELFDSKGVKIGTLTASSPTVWTKDGAYKPWGQKISPGQALSVSYVLSQPAWAPVADRRTRMYLLKAVVTVGGDDQVVKREVQITAETAMPPDMKT